MKKFTLIGAACLAAMSMSVSALAETTTYAGANCVPANNNTTYTVNSTGGISNYGNASISVHCLIPNVSGTNVINSITVQYRENNPTYDMLCAFVNGSTKQVLRSSGASQVEQTFIFNSTNISNNIPVVVSCTLPPNTSGPAPRIDKYIVETP